MDTFVKVWDRKTGALITNLTGGHTGRIFCVGFDFKKVLLTSSLRLRQF